VLNCKSLPWKVSLASFCLLGIVACTQGPNGQTWEQSFAPDPKLLNQPATGGVTPTGVARDASAAAQLPNGFPSEIPLYPKATLQTVDPTSNNQGMTTRWRSSDRSDRVLQFYRNALKEPNWRLEQRPTDDLNGTFTAVQNNLYVTIAVQPQSSQSPAASSATSADSGTVIQIQYDRRQALSDIPSTPSTPVSRPTGSPQALGNHTQASASTFELEPYLQDLAQLNVIPTTGAAFKPNQPVKRRDFIRWLITANNQIHANSDAAKIRVNADGAQPIFKDVPATDPDFAFIQAAAEAGLIPSALTGDPSAVLFRPNTPLTRETLLLWKVPLDIRRGMSPASIAAVQETWGFQDTARIDPKALRAVLTDYQNGDMSNIRRVFRFTTVLQPKRSVTRAEAAVALWYFGYQGDGQSAQEALQLQRQGATASPSPATGTAEGTEVPAVPTPAAESAPATPDPVASPPVGPPIPNSNRLNSDR
jgi:S-layer homology domain